MGAQSSGMCMYPCASDSGSQDLGMANDGGNNADKDGNSKNIGDDSGNYLKNKVKRSCSRMNWELIKTLVYAADEE